MLKINMFFKVHFLLYCLCLLGCNSPKKEITEVVSHWIGKEIVFPDNLTMKIYGKDTMDYSFLNHKYKILHYVDTSGCNECQLKFYEWQRLRKQIDSLQADVAIIYVVFAKHYTPVKVSQQVNRFDTPIIYDSLGIMDKQNNLSFNPRYKTFLLDSTNHVIGVGNPVTNKQVWEWYKTKICGEKKVIPNKQGY